MNSSGLFSKFSRPPHDGGSTPEPAKAGVPADKPEAGKLDAPNAGAPASPPDLLSCEDIYQAAGILHPHARYGIAKIVEMTSSRHIHELPGRPSAPRC